MVAPGPDLDQPGKLAGNIVHFARALRKAGLKIGAAAPLDAIRAVDVIGIGDRDAFKAALRAILVSRQEDLAVFEEVFALFWITPDMAAKMKQLMSPLSPRAPRDQKANAGRMRASNALMESRHKPDRPPPPETELDALLTMSSNEVLRELDFAQMTASELARARKVIARLVMPDDRVRTRRYITSRTSGRIDPRATMRAFLRSGGDILLPRFRTRREIQPPVVVLADISGSMSQYTRTFLHFVHLLTEKRRRVSTFLFGTRLTNVTRQMRFKDPDAALEDCAALVKDWSGGTRIGTTLRDFNRLWARRVLGQGAVVLLLTDGLEQDEIGRLSTEIDRLHRSCRRLIWLNPLLRFDRFEPRAAGIRAMLPHIDDFRPVHNLNALSDLVDALSDGGARTGRRPMAPRIAIGR
jgi:uncharacterized protein with von Willebrand factor type A (vWA) domain